MGILVYRDRDGARDFVGRIDYTDGEHGTFAYDARYIEKALSAGELGISELLPLDMAPYATEEFGPFFRGLLPEGEIYGNLANLYQVPRSHYLAILEQMGCECIGALTFVSEEVDLSEYEPRYERVSSQLAKDMATDPTRLATLTASMTRLSLSGAQSKIAWFLPREIDAEDALCDGWFTPLGTAPSTHIVKISRAGEEEIALNELACALLSEACGIETARTWALPEVSGAIVIERYDRVWDDDNVDKTNGTIVRLHQEDFCQALGLAPYFKYQPQHVSASYPAMMAHLLEAVSANPREDKIELLKRLVFCYAVGDSDAHLKNFSLLYNRKWTMRTLAPLYDVTCIPLTGYSTVMPFDIGEHRVMSDVDEHDMMSLATDFGIGQAAFGAVIEDVYRALEAPSLGSRFDGVEEMVERILDDSSRRIDILRGLLGA